MCPDAGPLLDAGCGTGLTGPYLAGSRRPSSRRATLLLATLISRQNLLAIALQQEINRFAFAVDQPGSMMFRSSD